MSALQVQKPNVDSNQIGIISELRGMKAQPPQSIRGDRQHRALAPTKFISSTLSSPGYLQDDIVESKGCIQKPKIDAQETKLDYLICKVSQSSSTNKYNLVIINKTPPEGVTTIIPITNLDPTSIIQSFTTLTSSIARLETLLGDGESSTVELWLDGPDIGQIIVRKDTRFNATKTRRLIARAVPSSTTYNAGFTTTSSVTQTHPVPPPTTTITTVMPLPHHTTIQNPFVNTPTPSISPMDDEPDYTASPTYVTATPSPTPTQNPVTPPMIMPSTTYAGTRTVATTNISGFTFGGIIAGTVIVVAVIGYVFLRWDKRRRNGQLSRGMDNRDSINLDGPGDDIRYLLAQPWNTRPPAHSPSAPCYPSHIQPPPPPAPLQALHRSAGLISSPYYPQAPPMPVFTPSSPSISEASLSTAPPPYSFYGHLEPEPNISTAETTAVMMSPRAPASVSTESLAIPRSGSRVTRRSIVPAITTHSNSPSAPPLPIQMQSMSAALSCD
ncbi:hypothetical protein BGX21_005234 [Mortierella sp. AD011]|nr:hypothetical protein BGX20_001177 [Mortierella sp. AD010]KAF9371195.1 hypothetical protein BGX21_005234 [Mortierella sp. AD011]